MKRYEYKFVRLGEQKKLFQSTGNATAGYQEAVHEAAQQGWRLVQVFAPAISGYGAAPYYELILERELQD